MGCAHVSSCRSWQFLVSVYEVRFIFYFILLRLERTAICKVLEECKTSKDLCLHPRNCARTLSAATSGSKRDKPGMKTRHQQELEAREQVDASVMQVRSVKQCLRAGISAASSDKGFIEMCIGKGTEVNQAWLKAVEKNAKTVTDEAKLKVLALVHASAKQPVEVCTKVCP